VVLPDCSSIVVLPDWSSILVLPDCSLWHALATVSPWTVGIAIVLLVLVVVGHNKLA